MTINIRTHEQAITASTEMVAGWRQPQVPRILLYSVIFVAIVMVVAFSYRSPSSSAGAQASGQIGRTDSQKTSVNSIVATVAAANVAETTNLPVASNVANLSVSMAAKEEIAASSSSHSVVKVQALQPSQERRTLISYRTKSKDTVSSLAKRFGISKDTLKWANDLTSNEITTGTKLLIPPVDGVIYVVQGGDSVDKIASKFRASKERIVAFNDLELTGLKKKKGKKIIIPAGTMPEVDRPGYVPSIATSNTGFTSSYSFTAGSVGNRYVYGYCTWYAYNQRAQMGKPIGSFWGNANTWAAAARSQGHHVDSNPQAGAIFQTSYGGGGYGHVGIIESVNEAAGTVTYSDMNGGAGWNRIGRQTIPISQAKSQWTFIH